MLGWCLLTHTTGLTRTEDMITHLEQLEDAILEVLQLAGVRGKAEQEALLGRLQLTPLLGHHLTQQLGLQPLHPAPLLILVLHVFVLFF